jgi:hypothetical protein
MDHVAKLPPLVIDDGETASSPLILEKSKKHLTVFTLQAPATLTALLTVQVSDQKVPVVWRNYQEPPGTDVTLAQGDAITIGPLGARALRVLSAGAEGAERSIAVLSPYALAGV